MPLRAREAPTKLALQASKMKGGEIIKRESIASVWRHNHVLYVVDYFSTPVKRTGRVAVTYEDATTQHSE